MKRSALWLILVCVLAFGPGAAAQGWFPLVGSLVFDANFAANTISGCASFATCIVDTRASSESCTDTTGAITYVTNNVACITSAGLQGWEARTNLTLQSQFASGWSIDGARSTLTPNSAVAPDGTTTAVLSKPLGNFPGSRREFYQYMTPTAGVLTMSVWAKPAGYNFAAVIGNTGNAGGIWYTAVVDLTSGSVTSTNNIGGSNVAASAVLYSNGWTRIQINLLGVTSGSPALRMGLSAVYAGTGLSFDSNGNPQFTGNGSGVYFWGAQTELAPSASPYIPTTAATAIRAADSIAAADVLTLDLALAKASVEFNTSGSVQSAAATLVDTNGATLLGKNTANLGTTALMQTLSTSNAGTWPGANDLILAWSPSGGAIQLNAGAVVNDAVSRSPAAPFTLLGGGSGAWNGNVTRLRVYNRALLAVGSVPSGTYRIVASGGLSMNTAAVTALTRNETRKAVVFGRQSVCSIKLGYAWVLLSPSTGETPWTHTGTLQAAFELTSPAMTVPATFSGALSYSMPASNAAIIWTDPIYPSEFGLSQFPASLSGFARTNTVVTANNAWPGAIQTQYSGEASYSSTAASTQIFGTGALTLPSGGSASFLGFQPVAIIGKFCGTTDMSVLAWGDSIMRGRNGAVDSGTSGGGMFTDSLNHTSTGAVPQVKYAIDGGDTGSFNFTAGGVTYQLMQYASILLDQNGTNGLASGLTGAQELTNKQAAWSAFRSISLGAKYVVDASVIPRGSSTDNNETLTNQTPIIGFQTGGNKRDALNNAVIALVGMSGGPDYYLNTSPAFADSVALDKWQVSCGNPAGSCTGTANWATTDTVHPNYQHGSVLSQITSAAATWPTN